MRVLRAVAAAVEFETNLMRAGSPVIPLAYYVEVLGERTWYSLTVLRTELDEAEAELINFETWPELRDPGKFLVGLLASPKAAIRTDSLTRTYCPITSLQVSAVEPDLTSREGFPLEGLDREGSPNMLLESFCWGLIEGSAICRRNSGIMIQQLEERW